MRGSGWDGTFFRFPKGEINFYLCLNHPIRRKVKRMAERNSYCRPRAEQSANRRPKAKQIPHPNPMAERSHRRNIDQSW